ncbi:Gfo/Idh/MocA family protein [Phytohalomonas tamaricis]|uniref:Gfo/Idh/MocA family protein n=1 Tax=Phytohalomonas tamaricis TaxID=2081032 RepID=UPI000D0BE4B1|nr:Gfo/Idh/MocA family oxidoreductase [Phytohalomonas tamaricis]
MSKIRIGIVGFGKIARDQHLPALRANDDYELVAVASRNASLENVANFKTLDEMLESMPELDAVSLCTPPQVRHGQARSALAQGKHVMLEKPPGATLSEVDDLAAQAERAGRTLFATWHSRHAPAVEPARRWLADKAVRAVNVQWKEDVRTWHPGQEWIWQPGGLGVFDPGINALSIITAILPQPFFLTEAELSFPQNRAAPIAANLSFIDASQTPIRAEFDWRQTGPQTWDIHIDTDEGRLTLSKGGSVMAIDGHVELTQDEAEYPGLYAHFATLIKAQSSDVDVRPLQHVADAFMLGRRLDVEPFIEE